MFIVLNNLSYYVFILKLRTSNERNVIDKNIRHWNQSRTFQLQLITGMILIFVGLWAGDQALAGEIAPTYIAAFTLLTHQIIVGLIPISNPI